MLEALRAVRQLVLCVDDVRWLVNMGVSYGAAWFARDLADDREIELIEKFRECQPLIHDPVIWSTECEFDRHDWIICQRSSLLPCEPRGASCET